MNRQKYILINTVENPNTLAYIPRHKSQYPPAKTRSHTAIFSVHCTVNVYSVSVNGDSMYSEHTFTVANSRIHAEKIKKPCRCFTKETPARLYYLAIVKTDYLGCFPIYARMPPST